MIPEAAVEAAARMLAETCDPMGDWDKQEESYRWIYRRRVMPCLQAAAPHMLAEAWDEGHLMGWNEATANTLPERESLWRSPYRPTP